MKNFIRKSPFFFESHNFVLKLPLAINLGSVKPTTDGRCCTHKSYLLDIVTHSNPFTTILISKQTGTGSIITTLFPGAPSWVLVLLLSLSLV